MWLRLVRWQYLLPAFRAGVDVLNGSQRLLAPLRGARRLDRGKLTRLSAIRTVKTVSVQIETLSETAYFVVDGVPMREVRIAARKPGHRPKAATHRAVYLGTMAQAIDDVGNVFTRGVLIPLNVHDWQVPSKSAARSAFLFLEPDDSRPNAAGSDRPVTASSAAAGPSRIDSSDDTPRTAG